MLPDDSRLLQAGWEPGLENRRKKSERAGKMPALQGSTLQYPTATPLRLASGAPSRSPVFGSIPIASTSPTVSLCSIL